MSSGARWIVAACAAFFCAAAAAQSPVLNNGGCIEPFATSAGYVLTPLCPPQPLSVLVDVVANPFDLLPPIDTDPQHRQALRIYERRIPGTEIYMMPSPLRNQWVYNPGQQLSLGTREAANEFVFGVRVPFSF